MVTPDPEILRLPATLREAERLATEHWGALFATSARVIVLPWSVLNEEMQALQIGAMAALLSDITTRPESRDAWVRLLRAARWGQPNPSAVLAAERYLDNVDRRGNPDDVVAVALLRACILSTFGASHA